jgi:polysaccharide export outer membrane protein
LMHIAHNSSSTVNMRVLFFYVGLALFFICSSCSNKQYQSLFERKSSSLPDSILRKNFANIVNYRIKSQDILQIRNLQNSKSLIDLTPTASVQQSQGVAPSGDTYPVEDDGTVALTGLGHVYVAGLTRAEAEKYIEDLYRTPLKNPVIELKIINLKVTLLGEVKGQASYPLIKDRVTLVELIGESGGLTDKADERNIEIIRGGQINPQIISIDLSDIKSISDPRTILQSGDIIYIPQNKRAIRNDRVTNFTSIIQPALLVLSTAILLISFVRK